MREGAQKAGYKVEGFAPTGRAVQQLGDAGVCADTLHGFLARGSWRQQEEAKDQLFFRRAGTN